jgi:retron-type reverse transcriptase
MKARNDAKGVLHSLTGISTTADLARILFVSDDEIGSILSQIRKHYQPRKQKKSDGTFRTLNVPDKSLRLLQRKIVDHILSGFRLPDCVYGGVPGRSIRQMAALHVGQPVVFKMDLSNFFPSIRPWMVKNLLVRRGIGDSVAAVLTSLVTFGNELPQGAPTSTAVANLVLERLDARLLTVCRQQGFVYSRWVDDLVFSGPQRLLSFRGMFKRVVEEQGFQAKAEKVKTMRRECRQEIVGLVVNRKVNLPREKREEIRNEVLAAMQSTQEVKPELVGKVNWFKSINAARGGALVRKVQNRRQGEHSGQ